VTRRCRAGVGAAVVLLLAVPGAAQAKTKTVNMGIPAKSGKAFQAVGVDVNDFFPHAITINKGDKIRFRPVGFHTFDLPATGGDALPLISPTGQKVAGVNDAAGVDFWFNGQDQVGFTPILGAGNFGKKLSFNGSKRIISGLPLADKPASSPSIALVDLLPGGFEPVQSRDANGAGSSVTGAAVEYSDVREDRVVVYAAAGEGVQVWNYRLRATNVGEFTVPTAFAQSMYERERQARSLAGRISVVAAGTR